MTLSTPLLAALALTVAGQVSLFAKIDTKPFGTAADGQPVFLYTLTNPAGMEVRITNYGATVASIKAPDRNKKFADVVLGFDSLDGYTAKINTSYFGAIVGRYGNRIARGSFKLGAHTYQAPVNDGENSLHG